MSNEGWIASKSQRPEKNQLVDWLVGDGSIVTVGKWYGNLWFLPPNHNVYCYYTPQFWRPSQRKEPSHAV